MSRAGATPTRSPSRGTTARLALVAALVVGISVAALIGSSGGRAAGTEISPAALQLDVEETIPGASGEISLALPSSPTAGRALTITPSREAVERDSANPLAYGDLAWRAEMLAASLQPSVAELVGYRLAAPPGVKVEVPRAALGLLQGSLPPIEAVAKLDKLDSVSEEEAREQLEASVATLEKGLPAATISSSRVELVPVGPDRGRFALAVALQTKDRAALLENAGDVFIGLQTGLVGSPGAVIEGLKIAVSEGTEPLASVWIASRAMGATVLSAPEFELPSEQAVRLQFANLTGGPELRAKASADVAEPPSLPTRKRLLLTSDGDSIFSAPGRISTATDTHELPSRYSPHLRPRLRVSSHGVVSIAFSAPAHSVKVAVQRPGRYESLPVGMSRLIGHRASDDGLRWRIRLPGWSKLEEATTLRITAAYPAGWGRYTAGIRPLKTDR